ncbi:MAG: TetR/AcrR family transcriptional regulator [Hyphomonadaceae bacterium]|jgi:AcrR family transcriptional regulator|nr:TetR/AcrR family transcriptional regulator [Hyphomonadaceae bacterium]
MTGIRHQQKHATRNRILASARQQLQTRSFEEVGVREIAHGAGVAAGTVIASFGSKADVLEALMIEDLAAQHGLALEAVAGQTGVAERLLTMMAVGIHYHARQPGLLQASMTAVWAVSGAARERLRDAVRPILASVQAELDAAKTAGEVRAGVDTKVAASMVFECLLATHAMSCNGVRTTEPMMRNLKRRLNLLLCGLGSPEGSVSLADAA